MIGVHIHRVSAHVLVISVPAVFVVVSVLCVRLVVVPAVVVAMVIVVVVAVAVVVSTVVVAAVPCGVSVIRPAVVHHRGPVPPAIPAAVTPSTASTAHHCSNGNSGAETNNCGGSNVARRIPRGHVR